MASIKISDLNSASSNTTSGWIELESHELESIHGGRRFRQHRQAVNNLIGAVNSQIESISGMPNPRDSFQITISEANSGGQFSTNINGVAIETNGNLFYTSSGVAPTGGVPIPGVTGAYTF